MSPRSTGLIEHFFGKKHLLKNGAAFILWFDH